MGKESSPNFDEGVKNPRFNRWIRNHTTPEGYPPDFYPMTIKVPRDIAVLFFRRFESHPLVDKNTRAVVKPGDLIAHLMWAYANGFAVGDQANVFEPFYKGLYRERKKKERKPPKPPKIKNPDEKRGRKPKQRQVDLFGAPPNPPEAGETLLGAAQASDSQESPTSLLDENPNHNDGGASEGSSVEP